MDQDPFPQRFRQLPPQLRRRVVKLARSGEQIDDPREAEFVRGYLRRMIPRLRPSMGRFVWRFVLLAIFIAGLLYSLRQSDVPGIVLYAAGLGFNLGAYAGFEPWLLTRFERTARANEWAI
jgi:hypothetical protein